MEFEDDVNCVCGLPNMIGELYISACIFHTLLEGRIYTAIRADSEIYI